MVKHILFDLDSTLYSACYGLEQFYFRRLREYTSKWLGLPEEESEPLREEGYKRHGTSVEWLIYEKGLTDVDAYFNYLHPENEADVLPEDPELRHFLETLPCSRSILTNSPRFHADRIIKKLGLVGVFSSVFDIVGNGFKGKPHPSSYRRALDALGLQPEEVLFVDDMPRYAEGYISLGGRGILLDEKDMHQYFTYDRIRSLFDLTQFL